MDKNEFEIELIRLGFDNTNIFDSIFTYEYGSIKMIVCYGDISVNDIRIYTSKIGDTYADVLSIINSELRSIKLKKLLNE